MDGRSKNQPKISNKLTSFPMRHSFMQHLCQTSDQLACNTFIQNVSNSH